MVLVFGDYRLDIERRELRCRDAVVALEPKAFDLLAFLVLQRDRVVSKDDLLAGVWGGRIVSESALTTRLNAVRRALGDNGAAQRLIRTFTRKGVRFIGEVTELPDPATPAAVRITDLAPPSDRPSIAVLPFANLSGDPEQDYFADGIIEEITTAIARAPWLFVIARTSSYTYKGKAVDVRQVAGELGVRYVLEGSVRKSGNQVRIAGQLIDTTTGVQIWAERFGGSLDDVFDLQDRVASGVAGAIEPRLHLAEIERARRKPTNNLDAYDLCLRAQASIYAKRTKESIEESIRLARQALALDPDYAMAMARIALSRGMQLLRHWIAPEGPEAEEGIRMARQAIAVGDDDPWVLNLAGLSLSLLAGDNHAALNAIDHAIRVNPNFGAAFGSRALVLAWLNRPDEAIQSAHQAIRLSPLDPAIWSFYSALVLAHLAAGRYEEGLYWAEERLRENADLWALRFKLSLCGHLGRLEEAGECLRRIKEIIPEPTVASVMQGHGKRMASEVLARFTEGLRKAGLPEE